MGGLPLATIRVSGSLESVKGQLQRIAAIVRFRKSEGWAAFLEDEVWEYFTEQDDRVCPVCEGFGMQFELSGLDVTSLFPDQVSANRSDTMHRHRYPNVHESANLYPGLRGQCRCSMFWRDGFMTLVDRLAREMEEVA